MTASRKMIRANRSGVEKKPAEELRVLSSKLLELRGQLLARHEGVSERQFDRLIGAFDKTQARIVVLEKQLKRERVVNRKRAKKKK